jgi:hypothetical protein
MQTTLLALGQVHDPMISRWSGRECGYVISKILSLEYHLISRWRCNAIVLRYDIHSVTHSKWHRSKLSTCLLQAPACCREL